MCLLQLRSWKSSLRGRQENLPIRPSLPRAGSNLITERVTQTDVKFVLNYLNKCTPDEGRNGNMQLRAGKLFVRSPCRA